MAGMPNAVLMTTLAVFRPTPGSFINSSRCAGHFAVVFFEQNSGRIDDSFRFVSIQPAVLNQLFHLRIGEGGEMFRLVVLRKHAARSRY